MKNIAVIGDRDSILSFSALGIDVFAVDAPKDCEEIIIKLAKENYAVIYITEQAAIGATEVIDKYKSLITPAIILIPGKAGSLGIGNMNVKKSVEKAVGADILFNDK